MIDALEFFTEEYVRRIWGVELRDTTVIRVPPRVPSFSYWAPYVPPKLENTPGWWAKILRFFGSLVGKRSWGRGYHREVPATETSIKLMQLHLWTPDALGLLHYVIDVGYVRECNILVLSEFRLV